MVQVLWKIFAVMTIAATFGGMAITQSEPASFWKSLNTTITIISCGAIFGYAFKKQLLPKQFATAFSWIFSAYVVWISAQSISNLYSYYAEGKASAAIAITAFSFLGILNFLEWLAVWRYGNSPDVRDSMQDMAKPE